METEKTIKITEMKQPCQYCTDENGDAIYHQSQIEITECRIAWENWAYEADLPAAERNRLD